MRDRPIGETARPASLIDVRKIFGKVLLGVHDEDRHSAPYRQFQWQLFWRCGLPRQDEQALLVEAERTVQ